MLDSAHIGVLRASWRVSVAGLAATPSRHVGLPEAGGPRSGCPLPGLCMRTKSSSSWGWGVVSLTLPTPRHTDAGANGVPQLPFNHFLQRA